MEQFFNSRMGGSSWEGYDNNITVEKQDLSLARDSAIRQTSVPAVTAADQVSIVLEPEEGEFQGASAAAQSDSTSHGGRAKFPKRR